MPRRLFEKLIDDRAELDHFLTEVASDAWNYEQDLGRSTAVATAELQAAHPEYAELIAAYYGRWTEMLGGAFPATVDLLRELRDAGVRLLALTNWSAEKFGEARARFDFLDWFDGIVVSGEERLAKPDPRIFDVLVERYAVDPTHTVYLDDNAGHVASARTLGFTGLHYTDVVALRRALADCGLPVRHDIDVRAARPADLPQLTEIYNHFVTQTSATFDTEPFTPEQRSPWFDQFADTGPHRLLVAVRDDAVVGYATSSRFRAKPAYDTTVETTIYLRPEVVGAGIGTLLYQRLFDVLREEGLHRAVAIVALPNDASLAMHRRFGFSVAGRLREIGRKHNRWCDVAELQRSMP